MKYHRISDYKIKKIINCFVEDLPATSPSNLLGINRNTINAYYTLLRERIFLYSIEKQKKEVGEFDFDESYFSAKRIRNKHGYRIDDKTSVFRVLKREGKVFVSIVPRCSREELLPIIQGKILEGSTIHTDGWKAYYGLIVSGNTHYQVFHLENEFVRGKSHVIEIENF